MSRFGARMKWIAKDTAISPVNVINSTVMP